jgi:hypothetical protein
VCVCKLSTHNTNYHLYLRNCVTLPLPPPLAGASIMGGFGFEGYTKEGKVVGWKGVENIDILGVETASSITVLLRHWNKRTQGWLERYTYARSGRSLVATYFISALWHGLYPGFFLMFYMLAFLTTIDRLLKTKLNPLVVPGFDGRDMSTYPKGMGGSVYWLLCIAGTQLFNNYGAQVTLPNSPLPPRPQLPPLR